MNSRRKFLIKSGMAATAVLAIKPFNAIGKATSPFTGFSGNSHHLVFLHTAGNHSKAIPYINDIKKNSSNTIILPAGKTTEDDTGKLPHDIPVNSGDYTIIYKGGIKTGVVRAGANDPDVINRINTISTHLKKERNCELVVCLSQLGYKNKNKIDDTSLASSSTHLDIIIGGHSDNYHSHPVIALNHNKEEVIIHSAAGNHKAVGKIEIGFDEKGRKRQVGINNSMPAKKLRA